RRSRNTWLNALSCRCRRASARFTCATRISSSVALAGPATGQPCASTITLQPRNGCPRSLPTRSAAATKSPFECAPLIASRLAITGKPSGCAGIGTQYVGAAVRSEPENFGKPDVVADRARNAPERRMKDRHTEIARLEEQILV